jgi:hypothetical protein
MAATITMAASYTTSGDTTLNQDKSELGATSPGLVHGSRSRCPTVTMLMRGPSLAGVSSDRELKPYSSMGFLRQSPP